MPPPDTKRKGGIDMLILGALVVLLVVGIVWYIRAESYTGSEICSEALVAFSGLLLFLTVIGLPLNYMDTNARIAQFNIVQATVDNARGDWVDSGGDAQQTDLETAALTIKIVQTNEWLASVQYWNRTMFDIWIPDAVEALQPIR